MDTSKVPDKMRGGRNRRSECHQHRGGVPNHEHELVEAHLPCITYGQILVGLHISAKWSRRASATADKLKPTAEIGLEAVVYTAAETVLD